MTTLVSRRRSIDVGKRAGVTSGLLGGLCVLAELCFLLPDVFVTREAMPLYREHLGLLRVVLQAAILTTCLLGATSIVLLRSKTYGLAGIGLALVALAMGGAGAEPVPVGRPRFAAGLDYFVLELLVLGLVFVPLERLYKLRDQPIFRRGWQTDLRHFFVSHAGVQLLSFASLVPMQWLFAPVASLPLQRAVAAQPLWLQLVEILFVVDFVAYWVHRAFHVVRPLWSIHAIHHSSLALDWLAGSRMHLLDVIVTRAAGFVPVFVLGFAPSAVYLYLAFVSFHAVFIHANLRWRFRALRWLVATPEFHHWHHTSDEEGIDKNFAVLLPILDVAFGTAHLPAHWPRSYGTVKFQPPETYLGQLVYPFQRHGEPTPYG